MLNILGGLDNYDDGDMLVDGKSTSSFTQQELDSYRSEYIGIIFQDYNLIPEYNVSENIALALELQGKTASDEEIRVALKTVDMEGYAGRRSTELSGGQRQRVAIARAIIKKSKLVLADEPTGNLDSETSTQIFEVLKELSKEALVIVITYDREYAEKYADRIIELVDGKVVKDSNPFNAEKRFLH
jgi:ABC-type antimicrobial peptide transport system, ATPase component